MKNTFDQIKQWEAPLRKIIDTIPALVWCGLPDGSKEFINQRWHDYTGLSPEESHGWGWKVRDRGAGFDPASLLDPLEPENPLNPTGRGILWMRAFMDEVEYSAHPEGGCVVRMKKYQRSSSKPPVEQ